MNEADAIVDGMARAIANGLGYAWEALYANKSEWIADGGRRQDINVPYTTDFVYASRAAISELSPLIEQAFRDGVAYGTNVQSADVDLAWEHSSIRAAIMGGIGND